MKNLNVSVVLYRTPQEEIVTLIDILCRCSSLNKIFLIDNSPSRNRYFSLLNKRQVTYHYCNENKGYGAGHNIAIRKSLLEEVDYHLVMNSDIEITSKTVDDLLIELKSLPYVGLAAPKILTKKGTEQSLEKFIPTPVDLTKRLINSVTKIKLKDNLLINIPHDKKVISVPYISGCFMLFRVSVLSKVGLFDERFFLYPEDIDLSRRIYNQFECLVFQCLKIKHTHKAASKRNLKLFLIHFLNIVIYFNKWGWFFDSNRNELNKRARENLT